LILIQKNIKMIKQTIKKNIFLAILLFVFQHYLVFAQKENSFLNPIKIVEFSGDQAMTRVNRPFVILASIYNPAFFPVNITVSIQLPEGVNCEVQPEKELKLNPNEKATLRWTIIADKPLYDEVILEIENAENIIAISRLPVRFLPEMEKVNIAYIPQPIPLKKDKTLLIGAHHCPLWEADSYERWSQLKKHPERTPALGFYAQENPEIADWETKWAIEHGIDFFIYCWYRIEQGGPVKQQFSSHIHKALFNSQFQNMIKFTIMWENQWKGHAGIANEEDLMKNLFPFWMENYFKRSNYLVVDNKPVLFIYRPEYLIEDLGNIENVRLALDKMREACRKEGFDGLWILGEYRGTDSDHLELMKSLGLDYSFAYCWPVSNSPTPQEAIDAQMNKIYTTQRLNILPMVVTISQGWSGWQDEGSIWKIPPEEFETLLRQAKTFIGTLPKNQLNGRMLLLDNWNEWGEGHYIAPCTKYGFEYLDVIRKVFSVGRSIEHKDLIPEDIKMGPYDNAYREWLDEKRKN
jgi:hypothetical protein